MTSRINSQPITGVEQQTDWQLYIDKVYIQALFETIVPVLVPKSTPVPKSMFIFRNVQTDGDNYNFIINKIQTHTESPLGKPNKWLKQHHYLTRLGFYGLGGLSVYLLGDLLPILKYNISDSLTITSLESTIKTESSTVTIFLPTTQEMSVFSILLISLMVILVLVLLGVGLGCIIYVRNINQSSDLITEEGKVTTAIRAKPKGQTSGTSGGDKSGATTSTSTS